MLSGSFRDSGQPARRGVTEHHRHNERPASFDVADRESLHVSSRKNVEGAGLHEADRFQAGDSEGSSGADARSGSGRTHTCASRDRGSSKLSIEPFHDVRGRCIGAVLANALDVSIDHRCACFKRTVQHFQG